MLPDPEKFVQQFPTVQAAVRRISRKHLRGIKVASYRPPTWAQLAREMPYEREGR